MQSNSFPKIYVRTPLVESIALRPYAAQRKVYLKLENVQPSGSFKLRGVSEQVKHAKRNGASAIVISSGGNAGLAAAYSALQLDMACRIVLPRRTPQNIMEKIKSHQAVPEFFGDSAQEVAERAEEISKMTPCALIHPSDHPLLYLGHSTIVREIAEDLDPGVVPSLIVASCGGGGLVCGLVDGIRKQGWENQTKILVLETVGTRSFNEMVKAGGERVKLEKIDSVVTSLSVAQVNPRTAEVFLEAKPPLLSRLVTDAEAIAACAAFADDHRFLVGPACGTTLAALYERIVERVLTHNEEEHETIYDKRGHEEFRHSNDGPVVVIVCGGAEIDLNTLEMFRKQFNV